LWLILSLINIRISKNLSRFSINSSHFLIIVCDYFKEQLRFLGTRKCNMIITHKICAFHIGKFKLGLVKIDFAVIVSGMFD